MKRRLITTILSCILSVAMVVPAWAEEITEEAVVTQENVDVEAETEDANDIQLSEDAIVVMEDAADITVEDEIVEDVVISDEEVVTEADSLVEDSISFDDEETDPILSEDSVTIDTEEEAYNEDSGTTSKSYFVWDYYEYSKTAIAAQYYGTAKNVKVPSSIKINGKTYKVTEIKMSCFENNTRIESVVIPKGVTYIGSDVFAGCTKLKKVTIPNTVTSIGYDAFCNCSSLTSISLPDSVTLGQEMFKNCTKLKKVKLPKNMTSIPYGMFDGCTSLECVSIPEKVGGVGWAAFRNCKSLKSIAFKGECAPCIYASAFENCIKLTSVKLPDMTTRGSFEYSTFKNCSSLKSLVVPNGMTVLDMCNFEGCTSLKSLKVADSIVAVYDDASVLKSGNITIYCHKGSWIESYAIQNKIKHVCLKTYNIKFDANGGKGRMSTLKKVDVGYDRRLPANKYKKSGYKFAGWATSRSNAKKGKVKYKNSATIKNLTTKNGKTVTLYAVWKKK